MTTKSFVVEKKLYVKHYCGVKKDTNYRLVAELSFFENEFQILRKRQYIYSTLALKWLEYLIPKQVYENILNFTTLLDIEKENNTIRFEIQDVENNNYKIVGNLIFEIIEPSQTKCTIDIEKFETKFDNIFPLFVKKKLSNHIICQLEQDIKNFL